MDSQKEKNFWAFVKSPEPFYVFGFGSLMWFPDFDYQEKYYGRVLGYHRRFGLFSWHYRGTPEQPGLVLGLDEGGSSVGICFLVSEDEKMAAAEKLWKREMITDAYDPKIVMVAIENKNKICHVRALAFALDPQHEQYAKPNLSLAEEAKIIATAKGSGGANSEYFINMVKTVKDFKIVDDYIDGLSRVYDGMTE